MRPDHALALAKGAARHLRAFWAPPSLETSDIATADYCYAVWLKHLTLLQAETGIGIPNTVLELGPGNTIGVGAAALLSGAERYIGVDAAPLASKVPNVAIVSEIADMIGNGAAPSLKGWPSLDHLLDGNGLPSWLNEAEKLPRVALLTRVDQIIAAMRCAFSLEPSQLVTYYAPLSDPNDVPESSVDLVISHSVLEHVDDLEDLLAATFRWLKPGGYSSHQFDLMSHGIVSEWDGHRAFDTMAWKLVIGARPYIINRLPYSCFIEAFERAGFLVISARRLIMEPTLLRRELRGTWRDFSEEEVRTAGGFIQVQKPVC
jgi:SAM-dependent methyltransferase